jgi:hypothetical protein
MNGCALPNVREGARHSLLLHQNLVILQAAPVSSRMCLHVFARCLPVFARCDAHRGKKGKPGEREVVENIRRRDVVRIGGGQALKGRANRQKTVAEQLRPNVSPHPQRRGRLDRPARGKSIWQRRKTR